MLFAATIRAALNAQAPPEGAWNDTTPFHMVLMDDSVLVDQEKDKEDGNYATSQIIWGLSYDTEKQVRSLPAPKLTKAAHLLALPDFNRGNRCVKLPWCKNYGIISSFGCRRYPSCPVCWAPATRSSVLLRPPGTRYLKRLPPLNVKGWVRFLNSSPTPA